MDLISFGIEHVAGNIVAYVGLQVWCHLYLINRLEEINSLINCGNEGFTGKVCKI